MGGANVRLMHDEGATVLETQTDADGHFTFSNFGVGAFVLHVTASGFDDAQTTGSLNAGELAMLPAIVLQISKMRTSVAVSSEQKELAEEEIKSEEKQRLFGVVPNYYVSYVNPAVPLDPKQKFELAWKTMIDPVSFGISAVAAGVEQSRNTYSGFGQGSEGYAKRFAASYADGAIGTLLGGAVFPTLMHQDPRYFVKGRGSKTSRLLYALANSIVCKGDNGRFQDCYSQQIGYLASAGLSNLYYPAQNRQGAALTFENFGYALAGAAGSNVFQEFFSRMLTPKK